MQQVNTRRNEKELSGVVQVAEGEKGKKRIEILLYNMSAERREYGTKRIIQFAGSREH